MGDPYGLPEELRRVLMSARTNLPEEYSPSVHNNSSLNVVAASPNTYDPNFMVGEVFFPRVGFPTHFPHHDYSSCGGINLTPPNNAATTTITTTTAANAPDQYTTGAFGMGFCTFDSGNNRWPRQETLSLLEIRSRLDSKFRENNQKAPLWNEISRIMAEEFGYQRSGKKCKEKFENLYKYYKKTKEGKASRQDGKHYRFFRQLEAICGDQSSTPHASSSSDHKSLHAEKFATRIGELNNSLSISNSSEFETSSSENNNDEDLSAIAYMMKQSSTNDDKNKGLDQSQRRVRKSSWRAKVEEIVDSHMRKILETQDAWMERMLSVVEQREQEMATKEERNKRESMMFDRQVHALWAKERAWVEARDAALIEVVKKHIDGKKELVETLPLDEAMVEEEEPQSSKDKTSMGSNIKWTEMEISNLIQLRTGFEKNGYLEEHNGLWDEIAGKLSCLGFERSASECKQIWDEISISLGGTVECGAKTRPWCLGLKLTDDDDI